MIKEIFFQGKTLTLSSNEGHLIIYNSFDCKVAISGILIGNFSIKPLNEFRHIYNPILCETDTLTIDVDSTCQFKAHDSKYPISMSKEKV